MNEQAVVITSFGTSVPEAQVSITLVEEALATVAKNWTCVRAFASLTIRRILRSCIHKRLSKMWKWEIMTIVSADETEIS